MVDRHESGEPTVKGRSRAKARTSPRKTGMDATELLKSQHREVEQLFKRFEALGEEKDPDEKELIVREACERLTLHATIEEEIFYPAARQVDDADSLLNEAEVEHASLKELIGKLDAMDAADELFDATFMVLTEYVKHHVKEEEGELFPRVKKADLDLQALGARLEARADELIAEAATA